METYFFLFVKFFSLFITFFQNYKNSSDKAAVDPLVSIDFHLSFQNNNMTYYNII